MANRTKEKIALGLGILAGGLLGYWLNSDQGREVRTDVADKANEYGEKAKAQADEISTNLNKQAKELSNNLNEQAKQLTDNINNAVEQSRSYISQASDTVRSQMQVAGAKANEASTDFQAGVDYAIKNIQKQAKELRKNGKS